MDSDRDISDILKSLAHSGFTAEELAEAESEDLNFLVPLYVSGVELLRLKIFLKSRKRHAFTKTVLDRLTRCVGRLTVIFQEDVCQYGTCVYVGNGFALTAYHVLVDASIQDEKGSSASKIPDQIMVELPNTKEGRLIFNASLLHFSIEDDLALLKGDEPLPSCFLSIDCLQTWPSFWPVQGDTVHLLSFPAVEGENRTISHDPTGHDDFPWRAEGQVTCVDHSARQCFVSCSCFGGGSGGLVVYFLSPEQYMTALHLGVYHETESLAVWNKSQLPLLNCGPGEKSHNAYFTVSVGSFLDSYFRQGGSRKRKISEKFLHTQVVRCKYKK